MSIYDLVPACINMGADPNCWSRLAGHMVTSGVCSDFTIEEVKKVATALRTHRLMIPCFVGTCLGVPTLCPLSHGNPVLLEDDCVITLSSLAWCKPEWLPQGWEETVMYGERANPWEMRKSRSLQRVFGLFGFTRSWITVVQARFLHTITLQRNPWPAALKLKGEYPAPIPLFMRSVPSFNPNTEFPRAN